MADNEDGYIKPLSQLHEYIGRFSYLGYASRRRAYFLVVHSLDRIDHDHIRFVLLDDPPDDSQTRLTQKVKVLRKFAHAVRTQLDLLQRFLS